MPPNIRRLPLFALAVLVGFSGCTGSASLGDHAEPSAEAPCRDERHNQPAGLTLHRGAHHIATPTGGSSGDGRRVEIPWLGDREDLAYVNVTALWSTGAGQQGRLALYLELEDVPYQLGPFNGESPLSVSASGEDLALLDQVLAVRIGTATDEWPGSTVALMEQDVTVEVTQAYRCV